MIPDDCIAQMVLKTPEPRRVVPPLKEALAENRLANLF